MGRSYANLPDILSPPRLLTFRSVGIFFVILMMFWIISSLLHYQQVRDQIQDLLTRQAQEMASTLALADHHLDRLLERLEEEQAARLVSVGARLLDMDHREPLTYSRLESVANEANVFNAVVFNSEGVRELGLRGFGFSGVGGRGGGGGSHSSESVLEFLKSNEPSRVQGLHRAGRMGEYRFSVWLRRPRGGALMINTDAEEQRRMIQELGPEALLREFARRSGIVYLERQSADGITFRVPEKIEPTAESFSVEVPGSPEGDPVLVVGFNTQPFRLAERELLQRLILSLFLIAVFMAAGLVWARFQRHHGTVAQTLDRIQGYHRAVLDHMEDAVLAWNDQDGLTFANPRARAIFPDLPLNPAGYPVSESIRDIAAQASASEGGAVFDFGIEPEKNKRYRAVVTTLAGTQPTSFLLLSDVSAVEQIAREQQQKEHLQALARMASGVAHEVRNPLNAIDMTIQTLCTEPSSLPEEDRRTLLELRQEVDRINRMVEHFLAYGRPQTPLISVTDLAQIALDTIRFLERLCQEKGIQIRYEGPSTQPLQADAQQLRQALLNILLNALEASSSESEVVVQIYEFDKKIVLQCRDRGIGMTPEQLHNVFEPYFTSKPKGTGLGMSIVKRIVEIHGGQIDIQSRLSEGTTVQFIFPGVDKTTIEANREA